MYQLFSAQPSIARRLYCEEGNQASFSGSWEPGRSLSPKVSRNKAEEAMDCCSKGARLS